MPDVTVDSIRSLLARQAHRDRNAPAAFIVLSHLDPAIRLVLTEGSTAEVRSTYQRRGRRPSQAARLADLVRNLEQHEDDALLSTYAEVDGTIVFLFLSAGEHDLLGCVVGPDHRLEEDLG